MLSLVHITRTKLNCGRVSIVISIFTQNGKWNTNHKTDTRICCTRAQWYTIHPCSRLSSPLDTVVEIQWHRIVVLIWNKFPHFIVILWPHNLRSVCARGLWISTSAKVICRRAVSQLSRLYSVNSDRYAARVTSISSDNIQPGPTSTTRRIRNRNTPRYHSVLDEPPRHSVCCMYIRWYLWQLWQGFSCVISR